MVNTTPGASPAGLSGSRSCRMFASTLRHTSRRVRVAGAATAALTTAGFASASQNQSARCDKGDMLTGAVMGAVATGAALTLFNSDTGFGKKAVVPFPSNPGRVAITGSSGIMGSRLCPALREDGWEVIGITRGKGTSQGGPGRDATKEVDLTLVDRICDFSDPKSMDSKVFEGCTHVFHLAAQGSPGASFEDILKSNIVSTYHAMECARRCGVKRFVLASTNHVQHGDSMEIGGGPGSIDRSRLKGKTMKLSDPAVPDSFYAASKLHNEAIGMLYSKVKSHMEVVSLRIGWVLYDDPTELKNSEFEHYLRAMFLSRRDCIGFCKAALNAVIPAEDRGYLCAYALSNNSERVFDLEETIQKLGYSPQDSADDFDWGK